ncbi:MAG: hypothetical protein ACKPKO_38675, partial [Candidatus Fonsibacter sp.]
DEIPDSDHGASLAITNYIMDTDQVAPPRMGQADTTRVPDSGNPVADVRAPGFFDLSLFRIQDKPPDKIPGSDPGASHAPALAHSVEAKYPEAETKRELARIDRAIKNNTRDSERFDKKLKHTSGLGAEHVATLQRERASCWKAIDVLRATRAAVLERGNLAALQ